MVLEKLKHIFKTQLDSGVDDNLYYMVASKHGVDETGCERITIRLMKHPLADIDSLAGSLNLLEYDSEGSERLGIPRFVGHSIGNVG